MLSHNVGFQKLVRVIAHLHSMGGDMSAYDRWSSRYREDTMSRLSHCCRDRAVEDFVSRYADSLADEVLRLLTADTIEDALEAPIDCMEELVAQAESLAQAVVRSDSMSAVDHGAVDPQPDTPEDYAQAA